MIISSKIFIDFYSLLKFFFLSTFQKAIRKINGEITASGRTRINKLQKYALQTYCKNRCDHAIV